MVRELKLTYPPMSEHEEQVALFQRIRLATVQHPELDLAFAVPNGGWRTARTGARLKDEGVKRGVPDTFFPFARGKFHGLFIELKALGCYAAAEQKAYHALLREQGYRVEVCQGWAMAWAVVEDYLWS